MTEQAPIAVRACVFDAYGTLFDFASAAASCRAVPQDKAAALTALWRDKQLQYSWLRGLQGLHADFWQVTGYEIASNHDPTRSECIALIIIGYLFF